MYCSCHESQGLGWGHNKIQKFLTNGNIFSNHKGAICDAIMQASSCSIDSMLCSHSG